MSTTTDEDVFIKGTTVRISVAFEDLTQDPPVLEDPSTGSLGIQPPSGTPIIIDLSSMVHDGTGLFHYDFATATELSGQYVAQAKGSGVIIAVSEPYIFTLVSPEVPELV